MAVCVADVMRHCRNFFAVAYKDGTFRISGNALLDVPDARWVYISGSMAHDGVWEVCDGYLTGRDVSGLPDEDFAGRVWYLAPPCDFLALCEKIRAYEEKNPMVAVTSERFGEYSYTRDASGWQSAFGGQLATYRRMYTEVG